MQNRNGLLTFIAACIPGVGYMYNGLIKKGAQILLLFMLIDPVFHFVGLGFLSALIKIPFWFYTFFDTFSVTRRIDRGEFIPDSEFIFKNYVDMDNFGEKNSIFSGKINKQGWMIIGAGLIGLGVLALFNQLFINNDIYKWFRFHATQYFMPILFIVIGGLILTKRK